MKLRRIPWQTNYIGAVPKIRTDCPLLDLVNESLLLFMLMIIGLLFLGAASDLGGRSTLSKQAKDFHVVIVVFQNILVNIVVVGPASL